MRLLLLLCLVPVAAAAQTRADMQCKATGKDLIYDCVIRLARGGEPVNGAQLTVGAGWFHKDRATASEIVVQVEHEVDDRAAASVDTVRRGARENDASSPGRGARR